MLGLGFFKAYKKAKGDCNVPQRYPDNPQLGLWVCTQRQYRKLFLKGEKKTWLSQERIDKLDEIGFEWDLSHKNCFHPNEEAWNLRYEELKAYKKAKGNCNVPVKYPDNPQLGKWVNNQRSLRKKFDKGAKSPRISRERIEKLDKIGFEWDLSDTTRLQPNEEAWDLRYEELKEYKEANGNCNVPDRYPTNPQLGRWVSTQRKNRKHFDQGDKSLRMTQDRINKLNKIGFVWSLR